MSLPTPYYEAGGVTLYCGDCREILPAIARECPIENPVYITDPPYGIEFKSNGQIFQDALPIEGDQDLDCMHWILEYAKHRPLCVFFSPFRPPLFEFRSVLCWAKGAHVGAGGDRATCWKRDLEMVGVAYNGKLNGKRDSAVLKFNAESPPPHGHPAEKPVSLLRYLVGKLTGPEDTVVDPFAGVGSTLAAAMLEGREAIGVELSPEYAERAASRLEALRRGVSITEKDGGQTSIFDYGAK